MRIVTSKCIITKIVCNNVKQKGDVFIALSSSFIVRLEICENQLIRYDSIVQETNQIENIWIFIDRSSKRSMKEYHSLWSSLIIFC